MEQPVQNAIRNRRSIREFTGQPVSRKVLHTIVQAGIWAPSGLNNQPWRFILVRDRDVREKLAPHTTYSHIILGAPALIVVLLDREAMYSEVKDHQAAGACIQNMLLAAEELGLGAVWLGQILQNSDKVNALLSLDETFELMAVLALGYPLHRNQKSQRKPLADFILQEIGGDQE
ncbi:MAG: nitroreductase family protein [Desulfobulbaceae bacterium]|nr:nitroreductase family protein [Desulfobulbaceae bacterium]